MFRKAKVVLWVVVLVTAGVLVAVSLGIATPYLAPSALPVGPSGGLFAGVCVVVGGVAVSTALDALGWRQLGAQVGLTSDGVVRLYDNPPEGKRTVLAKPTLTGTVGGRRIRARTYRTDQTATDSTINCTVVEADLDPPVDWTAMFAPVPATEAEIHHMPTVETEREHWTTIDGEFAVWGSIPEATARAVLSADVRNALGALDTGVVVGDVGREVKRQMASEIKSQADGEVESRFLSVAEGDEATEPSRTVSHTARRPVRDAAELERRVQTVAALAEAVELTDTPQ